jgi:uncharacterized protein (DUF608 family)
MKITITTPSDPRVRSGVYIGGIGAGGFEPRPDGRYYRCQIHNQWRTEQHLDLSFLHSNGKQTRILRLDELNIAHGTIPGVRRIEYEGAFPHASLAFPECGVTLDFSSFFVPGDVTRSALPACCLNVRGAGSCMMFFPVDENAEYRIGKDRIVVAGKQGSIAIRFGNALVGVLPRNNMMWYIHNIKSPKSFWKAKPRGHTQAPSYIAILWHGTYDEKAIIAWHYPDSRDFNGNFMGHWYARSFGDAGHVLSYVMRNRRSLQRTTDRFRASVLDSRMPDFVKEAYLAQMPSFTKQSWLAKDGRFGVWEGACCCCGIQTTDVAYYGSWLYARLFPELEKSAIMLTARHQRADGWIPHAFYGNFSKVDLYVRRDLNMQFVMMAFRDWKLWRDRAFLSHIYPHVKRALALAYTWDADGDMIPEVLPRGQTFDAWEFKGPAIYVASLWLASLRMAAIMARAQGDFRSATRWEHDFSVARTNTDRLFWNGEYFSLAIDGKKRDDCCLVDALSGDWYCRLLGLGGLFDDLKVRAHLRAVLKYNRKTVDHSYMKSYVSPGEKGFCIINGGYKDNRRIGLQQYEPWTGMEYAFALHCWLMGMKREALQTIRDVHERLQTSGHTWNHVECGGEYFRPMVIGALAQAMKI